MRRKRKSTLLARFASILERLMAETEGFVMIDEMVLNEDLFGKNEEPAEKDPLPKVWVCLPREVMKVAGHHFAGLLNRQLLKEGPMTVHYQICQVDQQQMEQLLIYRHQWLSGLMGLQKLTKSAEMDTAQKAVGAMRNLLNNAQTIKPMVA